MQVQQGNYDAEGNFIGQYYDDGSVGVDPTTATDEGGHYYATEMPQLDAHPLGDPSMNSGVAARPATSASNRRGTGGGGGAHPLSAEEEAALKKALAALPKVFVAVGGQDQLHKVRDGVGLSGTSVVGQLRAGEEVVVVAEGATMGSNGLEVERYHISAPTAGWISASNFHLAPHGKQSKAHIKKLEKAATKQQKAAAKAKDDAEWAEVRKEVDDKFVSKSRGSTPLPACAGPWYVEIFESFHVLILCSRFTLCLSLKSCNVAAARTHSRRAKGKKAEEHKIRKESDLNSHIVGKIRGGMKVNVVAEVIITKSDGNLVHRLQINMPKNGWISAANFEHLKKGKK